MYDRELVERLLPAVWDEAAVYGIPVPQAPPQDMPRGSVNPAHGNTLYAHLADIHAGWEKTDLNQKKRQALLVHFGLGTNWTLSSRPGAAVPVLPPTRFPGPLAEPAVPISRQRALHGVCRQAGFVVGHGVGILFPR